MTGASITTENGEMAYDIDKLIEFYNFPLLQHPYYYGDVTWDTIDALEDARTNEANLSMLPEILAQLPEEDELCEIIDTLTDALSMKKEDMRDQIKKVIEMLEQKNYEFMQRAEHAVECTK